MPADDDDDALLRLLLSSRVAGIVISFVLTGVGVCGVCFVGRWTSRCMFFSVLSEFVCFAASGKSKPRLLYCLFARNDARHFEPTAPRRRVVCVTGASCVRARARVLARRMCDDRWS